MSTSLASIHLPLPISWTRRKFNAVYDQHQPDLGTSFNSSIPLLNKMDPPPKPNASLFEVYLRLRPSPFSATAERFLDVEDPVLTNALPPTPTTTNTPSGKLSRNPRCITIRPPASDHRKRAVEKFAFTRVFEEPATQTDIFDGTGMMQMLEGVMGANGKERRDGLLATLGVTGSGKVD